MSALMRYLAVTPLALMALAPMGPGPAWAQEPAPPAGEGTEPPRDGAELIEEGARLLLRGLLDGMEPALREFGDGMRPALQEFLRLVDDIDAYELPQRLPNGDIIIRRKPGAAPWQPGPPQSTPDQTPDSAPQTDPETGPDGEVEI